MGSMRETGPVSRWAMYLDSEIRPLRARAREGKGVRTVLIGGKYLSGSTRKFRNVREVVSSVLTDEYGLFEENPAAKRTVEVITEIAPRAMVEYRNVFDPYTETASEGDIMGSMVEAVQSGANVVGLLFSSPHQGPGDCRLCDIAKAVASKGCAVVCGPGGCPKANVDGIISVATAVAVAEGIGIDSRDVIREAKLAAFADHDFQTGVDIGVSGVVGIVALLLSGRKGWWHRSRMSVSEVECELKAGCTPVPSRDCPWRIQYGLLRPSALLRK